ncbi:MAG TPA: phage baseplate assembly protein V [Myxococcaceae bacterium]|nr:phage baseplate assembly protein V [Myxococcaceae bacterium]
MIEQLLQQLIERVDQRYYGKYRGYVHKVDDPQKLGRVQAVIPRLLGETPTGWCMPCTPYAGPDQGLFTVPDVGTGVWIEFEGGDLSRPIWTGMWWGKPGIEDIGQSDSTARVAPEVSELPKHDYPAQIAEPGVRILKSATGHYIVMDDRPETARIEIHDRQGNRLIFSSEGLDTLVSNERTVNEGNRSSEVDGSDSLDVSGTQDEHVGSHHTRKVDGNVELHVRGDLREQVKGGGFSRTVDKNGLRETVSGGVSYDVSGSSTRNVKGTSKETAIGGWGVTAGGHAQISAGGAFKVAATTPDGPNAISLDALLGNISIGTKVGVFQLGGISAVSPMVLGDGLAIHLAMLAQILKAVNPLTVAAYGPLLDAWAAMTPLVDWSLFGFVKRFPVG